MKYKCLSYENLPEYGIQILTGEACAFGQRLLCDLNEDGITLVADFLGLNPDPLSFRPRMNSQVNGKPSLASMMLTRGTIQDILKFILCLEGWEIIVQFRGDWIGRTEETHERAKRFDSPDAIVFRNWKSPGQPSIGSRNVHAMTGRHL